MTTRVVNIAARLRESAVRFPEQRAVVFPAGHDRNGRTRYHERTFSELERETDLLAWGLQALGITPGTRIVLMVRPGFQFIALTFALFKLGAVVVLIDPGMGGRRIFDCLDEVEPEGFVAIPMVQIIRMLSLWRYRKSRFNVVVGPRLFWPGTTYARLLQSGMSQTSAPFSISPTGAGDPAAIIFTSGSTGPPKGVVYEHGMFAAQVEWIQNYYQIQPGEIDLPGFPLFGLFNAAMGVTTVIPEMNPARPAQVDPRKIVAAIIDQNVTQSFGSPAIWNRVGQYCVAEKVQLPTLRRVLSAGAPVPIHVLERMRAVMVAPAAEMHTPYGATESLPVCSISASEVLDETAAQTRIGRGTCVGLPFPQIRLAIIPITNEPISEWNTVQPLGVGEIGEIAVQGDVVTREYYRRLEATVAAKIPDGNLFWHRMGDVGYRDATGRLWFCGRKSQIVWTAEGPLYTERIEPIFQTHRKVLRAALVGIGQSGHHRPVLIVEPREEFFPIETTDQSKFVGELQEIAGSHDETEVIEHFLFHRSLPVDVRHNVKINREALAAWAAEQLR